MSPDEQYEMHRKAFRCAFDFLNAHFPPGEDPEWWEQAAEDVSTMAESHKGNELASRLLDGVYEYISIEWKRRYNNERNEN